MVEIKKRVKWIDIIKGISIIFIVVYHAGLTHKSLYGVDCFAVPLFLFIAGYLFNPDVTFLNLLQKGFNSLLKPYFFTVILISLTYVIFKDGPSFIWYFFWMIYGNGPNLPKLALHLWFLPSLFATRVVVWLALRKATALRNSLFIQILFLTGLLACGYYVISIFWDIKIPWLSTAGNQILRHGLLDNPAYRAQLTNDNQFMLKGLPWSLDAIFVTAFFFVSGYVVKKNNAEEFFHRGTLALCMTAIFCILLYFFDYQIDINMRHYDAPLLTVQVFAGIYISMYLSNIIGNWDNVISKVFKYIGQYSLIIYIFHGYMLKIVNKAIILFNLPDLEYFSILPLLLAGVGLPLLLNWLLLERFKCVRYWYYAK